MAKGGINTGEVGQPIHTRTSGGAEESQAVVIGIDGSDSVVPASVRGVVTDEAATGITTGRLQITTSGTPQQVTGSSTPCKAVAIYAWPGNATRCMVGDSNVRAANGTFRGLPIEPGGGVVVSVANANLLWVDAATSTEGVTWTILT